MVLKKEKIGWLFAFAILPVVAASIMCIIYNSTIFDVYAPNSRWNDEVLYYMQVAGMKEYGLPMGYFGYNESQATYLSFASWSPVLLVPWYIFSLVFGWGCNAPIICNILLMCIATCIFYVKVKPNNKQSLMFVVCYLSFSLVTRYVLSSMCEAVCWSLVIIYCALVISIKTKSEIGKNSTLDIVFLYIIIGFLSLMRGYYILFVAPLIYWKIQKKRNINVCFDVAYAGILAYVYLMISRKLCAPYFCELIDLSWLNLLFVSPLEGVKQILFIFASSIRQIITYIGQGIVDGSPEGACYVMFVFLMAIYVARIVRKQDIKKNIVFLCCAVMMLLAIIYLYDIRTGSRHIIGFIICGQLFLILDERIEKKELFVYILLLLWCFVVRGTDEYIYNIPFETEDTVVEISSLNQQLQDRMIVDESGISWDNTIIWLADDESTIKWQDLYSIPSGMAINDCTKAYVIQNFDRLKSKYILVNSGQEVDRLCESKGANLIGEYGQTRVWQLR